jgi:hypothetical protein
MIFLTMTLAACINSKAQYYSKETWKIRVLIATLGIVVKK